MPTYSYPGVYVEEVPSAIKPIAGVSTSTAAFVGIVSNEVSLPVRDPADPNSPKRAKFTVKAVTKVPELITNWTQFSERFGGLVGDPSDPEDSAGTRNDQHGNLAHAVYGFFNNGGSRCYVVRIAAASDLDDALKALARIDEIALVAAPGMTDKATLEKLATHCANAKDRFAILDGPETMDDLAKLTVSASSGGGKPKPPAGSAQDAPAAASWSMPQRSDFAALYFPWVRVFDPATKLQSPRGDGVISVPPSGHVAGIYARVDGERGVHKAPANEAVRGALGVAQSLSNAEQEEPNRKGANCIRMLNGSVLVWGARTVGGDANADLKYVNVRRTLIYLRKSIEQGTQWVVFEPNTPALWQKITRNVTAFLTDVWRSGALFGATTREAFYVKCDAENNPASLRDIGQVVTEIGVAIARPAEFVIFRISQFTASEE